MSIQQTRTLSATPHAVFHALATTQGHTALTGVPADLEPVAGTAWSAYGGGIHGWTLDAEPGVRLVQAWRAGNWAPGVFSLVRWDLAPEGDGTRATLTHTACPEGTQAHLEAGWDANYWSKLAALTG